MKKFLSFCLVSFCFAFSMIFSGCEINTYTLEQNTFETTIAYGSDIDFSSLTITKNAGKDSENIITVTPDMVVSYGDTNSVGQKQAVIEFEGQTLTLDYWVKYKVDFWVEDSLYNSQYVLSKDDLIIPENPSLDGYDFVSWDSEIPQEIDDNQTFNALFTVEGSGVPKLSTIKAVFGDTLQDHLLPQNSKGSWQYVMPQETSVGSVGTNTFEVVFNPTEEGLLPITDVVTISVSKKTLEFLDMQTSFDYDGTEKTPQYSLGVADVEVEYIPYYQDAAIDSGEYEFELEIVDDNYKGSYYGSFTINKISADIIIDSKEIDITDETPTDYDYIVKNKNGDEISQTMHELMDIEIVAPQYNHAGTYPISAIVNNPNFNVNIQNGYLTVQKVEHDLTNSSPVFTDGYYVTYGSKLSSLSFEESDVRGVWSFEDDSLQVLTPGQITVNVIFTPHETADFLPSKKQILLNVNKKVLSILVDQNEYTYDGNNHGIVYSVQGVEDIDEQSVEIDGNLDKTTAGSYATTLIVSPYDLRYVGSTNTTLIINKAKLADFSTEHSIEWSPSLLLSDVMLPQRYTWEKPLLHITDLGKQNFVATYTPEDTINYEIETSTFVVDVTKATASITLPQNYTFEYSKQGYTLSGITASHEESSFEYAYFIDDTNVDKIDNTGTYEVCVTLLESAHYKVATATTTVVVTKAINRDVLTNNISAVYGDQLSKYTLQPSDFGVWQWQNADALVGNTGTQTHKAVFTATDTANYENREVDVTFIVEKKTIQIPTIEAKTYSGETLVADIEDSGEYTVTQNNGGQEMGSYDVVLTLKDSSNYRWAGNNALTSVTVKFDILKNANNKWIEAPYIESFTYGAGFVRYIATPAYGIPTVTFIEKNSNNPILMQPTNVGDYFVKFVVEETENYNGLEATLEFSITHKIAVIPTLSDITYTGSPISADIADTEAYTVEQNDNHTVVGEYSVKLRLVDGNYKWSDGSLVFDREVKYNIIKNEKNDWTAGATITGWVYNPNGGSAPTATATFGSPSIMYKEKGADNTTYTAVLPVNAGAYVAKFTVADTDNYNGLEKTVDFVISQATPMLNAPVYDMTSIYYENNINVETLYTQAPSVAGNIEGNITFAKAVLETTNVDASKAYERVAFNVTFTPTDSRNYQVTTASAYINLYKVAFIGNTYYGSIENAAAKAVSGDNIIVIPDNSGNVTIASDMLINSGVTLTLPHLSTAGEIEANTTGVATLNAWNGADLSIYVSGFTCLNLTTKVVVKQNVVITNNGTIVISGELSGGSAAGVRPEFANNPEYKANGIAGNTARNYAKIVLQSGAKIISNGIINCTGYIDEESSNNGSEVVAKNGKVYMPFLLHDFRGGNYMYSAISYSEGGWFNKTKIPIAPFNQFELRNIVPRFTIEYNATLIGYANLFAGKKNNFTEGVLVGNSASALIQFTSQNSYMIAKYNIVDRPAAGSDKWADGICDIDFYGGATTNVLSLKVNFITDITVTTKDVFFPLSWRQNITVHNGNFTLNNKFKLMPGAKFTIDSDAVVNANMLTVYEEFDDLITKENGNIIAATQYDYNRTLAPAEFIVKGTLNVTSLGGKVIAGADGAVVKVTNTSCKSYEITSGQDVMLGDTKIGWNVTAVYITGSSSELINGANTVILSSGGTYTAKDGTWSK